MLKKIVKFSYSAQKLQFQTFFFPARLCVTEKRTHVNKFIFPIFKQFCFQYPLINYPCENLKNCCWKKKPCANCHKNKERRLRQDCVLLAFNG